MTNQSQMPLDQRANITMPQNIESGVHLLRGCSSISATPFPSSSQQPDRFGCVFQVVAPALIWSLTHWPNFAPAQPIPALTIVAPCFAVNFGVRIRALDRLKPAGPSMANADQAG